MVDRKTTKKIEKGTKQQTFGGEQAEEQKRRQQYAQERGSPTKRQRNRDPKHLPIGSLATD